MTTVEFDNYDEVQSWLNRELPVMVALLRQAIADGDRSLVDAARIALQTLPFYLNSALQWTQRTALASREESSGASTRRPGVRLSSDA